MKTRRIAASAGLVGILGFVAQYVPSQLLHRWFQGGPTGDVPAIGTSGQTVVTYNLLFETVGPLVTVLLAVWFGYRVGDRLDLSLEYRRFVGAVAVGSLGSAVVVWVSTTLVGPIPPATPVSALIAVAVLVRLVATVSLVVTVGAFAGAALSHFRANEETSARPTGADADGRANGSGARN